MVVDITLGFSFRIKRTKIFCSVQRTTRHFSYSKFCSDCDIRTLIIVFSSEKTLIRYYVKKNLGVFNRKVFS